MAPRPHAFGQGVRAGRSGRSGLGGADGSLAPQVGAGYLSCEVRTRLDQTTRGSASIGFAVRCVVRVLSALAVLLVLALPGGKAAAATPTAAQAPSARHLNFANHFGFGFGFGFGFTGEEDGACEDGVEPRELLECGAQIEATLDEPLVITLLRMLDVRLPEDVCTELLADIWSQQVCIVGSRECGKMNAGTPPPAPHEWVSSSASGHSSCAGLGLSAEAVRRLGFADRTRPFASRDVQPPVPPPRLSGH